MNTTQSAYAATKIIPFASRYNTSETPLFEVRSGIPVQDALNQAANLLDAAYELAFDIGMDITRSVPHSGWAITYLTEMAKAVVDSVNEGLLNSEREAIDQEGHTQAEAIARTRFPLAEGDNATVSMPLHILVTLIQKGIHSASTHNGSQEAAA